MILLSIDQTTKHLVSAGLWGGARDRSRSERERTDLEKKLYRISQGATYLMTRRTSATKHRGQGGGLRDNAAIVRSGARTSLSSHSQGGHPQSEPAISMYERVCSPKSASLARWWRRIWMDNNGRGGREAPRLRRGKAQVPRQGLRLRVGEREGRMPNEKEEKRNKNGERESRKKNRKSRIIIKYYV